MTDYEQRERDGVCGHEPHAGVCDEMRASRVTPEQRAENEARPVFGSRDHGWRAVPESATRISHGEVDTDVWRWADDDMLWLQQGYDMVSLDQDALATITAIGAAPLRARIKVLEAAAEAAAGAMKDTGLLHRFASGHPHSVALRSLRAVLLAPREEADRGE